eukprot:1142283-Pelagomonas_calceolata.AAC.3
MNPLEYIRRDAEGSDSDTRRRAAADLVKSLTEKFPSQVTQLFTGYVQLAHARPRSCLPETCSFEGHLAALHGHCAGNVSAGGTMEQPKLLLKWALTLILDVRDSDT